jgi:hypothetical protein
LIPPILVLSLHHSHPPRTTPPLHHSITPILHRSSTPPLQYSIAPVLHHSTAPLLRAYSIPAQPGANEMAASGRVDKMRQEDQRRRGSCHFMDMRFDLSPAVTRVPSLKNEVFRRTGHQLLRWDLDMECDWHTSCFWINRLHSGEVRMLIRVAW